MDGNRRQSGGAGAHVVVFPSAFGKKTALLMGNIKRMLRIRGQRYDSVRRDGSLIVVDADDPVLASSAISLLFGIERVAIAKRIGGSFEEAKAEMVRIGSSLLLAGDVFFVRVEGKARGFVTGDLEAAVTSSIIERCAKSGARPGTAGTHDRLLYTFLSESHAYVCIFTETGLGGVPYGAHGSILCPVFDGLSAVSCLEAIKQGFHARIIACYARRAELPGLARMLSRIIPRMVKGEVELRFFKVGAGARLAVSMGVAGRVAAEEGISRVALPVTPLTHPAEIIDGLILDFAAKKIASYAPLGALEYEMYTNAREIGIEGFAPKAAGLRAAGAREVEGAMQTSSNVTVRVGPNNVHDILDGLAVDEAGP